MFGSFNKSNKSTTNYSTTNNYTDDSANAGGDNSMALGTGAQFATEGGISVGQGANVSIQTSDPQVVGAAMQTVQAAQVEGSKQFLAALQAVQGTNEVSSRNEQATQEAANLAIQNSNALAKSLSETAAAKASDPSIQIVGTVGKYAAIAAGLLVLVLIVFRKGSK